jgi:hypothetical protein
LNEEASPRPHYTKNIVEKNERKIDATKLRERSGFQLPLSCSLAAPRWFPTVRARQALGMLGLNEATNQRARNPLPRAIKQKLRKFQARRLYISKRSVRVESKNSRSEPIDFVAVRLFGCLPGRFPDNTFEPVGSRGKVSNDA